MYNEIGTLSQDHTLVVVFIRVELSFEALEELAPTPVLPNFLTNDTVNLLISLTSVKLSDMWGNLEVDPSLLEEVSPGLLLIGVAIPSLLEWLGVFDFTGVELNLGVPITFNNLNEETACFFLPVDCKIFWSKFVPCRNYYFCSITM